MLRRVQALLAKKAEGRASVSFAEPAGDDELVDDDPIARALAARRRRKEEREAADQRARYGTQGAA